MHKIICLTKKKKKTSPTRRTKAVRSLQPAPGGELLADYAAIKAGHYNGPPLHTATTALAVSRRAWDLAPARFASTTTHGCRTRATGKMKVTRYAFSTPRRARRYSRDSTPREFLPLSLALRA